MIATPEVEEIGVPHGALTRRQLLGLAAAGAGVLLLPAPLRRLVAAASVESGLPGGYLTAAELVILDAATGVLVPSDTRSGARDCGAADYIQSLLSFGPGSDANCDRLVNAADVTATVQRLGGGTPACGDGGDVNGDGVPDRDDVTAGVAAAFAARPLLAGGPFSGRNPQAHFPIGTFQCGQCHGAAPSAAALAAAAAPVEVYPPNAFRQSLPLTRLQRLSWQIRLLGPDAVPQVADTVRKLKLPDVDLRQKYRTNLAALDDLSRTRHQVGFAAATAAQQSGILDAADPDFVLLLRRHTIEGMLCAPEYGGNRNRLGWQLIGFDGDSQPQGFAVSDASAPGGYRERTDKPNSTPDPGERCAEFTPALIRFLTLISSSAPVQPGQRFEHPDCLGVVT